MSRIAVLMPTKFSPDGAAEAYVSMLNTSVHADMIMCVEEQDRERYAEISGDRLQFYFGPETSPAPRVNAAAEAFPDYEAYGTIVDDATFLTPGWDEWVLNRIAEFPHRLGVVSPAHNTGPWCNFPFVSRQWIDALGWLACPSLKRYCWDTVLELLGESTHIAHATADQFSINHQMLAGPNRAEDMQEDGLRFFAWCFRDRRDAMAKLRGAMS